MIRFELQHEPLYFQFYICDPQAEWALDSSASAELEHRGFTVRPGQIAVGVISEFSKIPITVEVSDSPLVADIESWDFVVECPFETRGDRIILLGCTASRPFGVIPIAPGVYRVRIYYGGQFTQDVDRSTRDRYLLQIWPSSMQDVRVIKGPDAWPRPVQPCWSK